MEMMTTQTATTLSGFPTWRMLEGGDSSLASLVGRFQQSGGHLDEAVRFDLERGTADRRVEGIGNSPLYPVCEAGMNRSQITYRVAKDRRVRVMAPHGTMHSVDMVVLPPAALQTMLYTNLSDFQDTDHPFYQHLPEEPLFGSTMRVMRFGEEYCRANGGLSPLVEIGQGRARANTRVFDRIRHSRQWMEANYFLPLIQNGGVVLAYNRAVHGMLYRLLEVAERHSLTLERVRIIPIESTDPCVSRQTRAFSSCVTALIATAEEETTTVHQKMWTKLYRIDCATDHFCTIIVKAFLWLISLFIIPPVVIWCGWSLYDCCNS